MKTNVNLTVRQQKAEQKMLLNFPKNISENLKFKSWAWTNKDTSWYDGWLPFKRWNFLQQQKVKDIALQTDPTNVNTFSKISLHKF